MCYGYGQSAKGFVLSGFNRSAFAVFLVLAFLSTEIPPHVIGHRPLLYYIICYITGRALGFSHYKTSASARAIRTWKEFIGAAFLVDVLFARRLGGISQGLMEPPKAWDHQIYVVAL